MQLREVSAQVDTGAQDKQMQLGLLGSSDAVFQQRNRELAIAEGELSKLEQELQQAKFELLQVESTVARLRTDCSGYEVEQKTSAASARCARPGARPGARSSRPPRPRPRPNWTRALEQALAEKTARPRGARRRRSRRSPT